jgi:competence protein ComEC
MTGDIEAPREIALLSKYSAVPYQADNTNVFPVDILMIPHHGSQSSSTLPFILGANPLVGLTSTASGNRYGHPHASVITRYRLQGVATFDTAGSGEITVMMSAGGIRLYEYRREWRRFWHQSPPEQRQRVYFDAKSINAVR